ncbi:MAG: hypothetical protein GF347_01250 [Candidatus Moranbacteria bacterium]|nr:hypothetical protein [Candidatus Moranbacteria bacterium]
MVLIHSVDTEKPFGPIEVRNAIVECFYQAHKEAVKQSFEAGDKKELDKMTKDNIKHLIKKAFQETSGDFEKPTKRSIIEVMDYLKEFSKSFRDDKTIEKNYNKIMILVNKL